MASTTISLSPLLFPLLLLILSLFLAPTHATDYSLPINKTISVSSVHVKAHTSSSSSSSSSSSPPPPPPSSSSSSSSSPSPPPPPPPSSSSSLPSSPSNPSPAHSHTPLAVSGPASIIVGTYVADCENTSWFVPGAPALINLTSAKTFRYWDNGTFAIDYTEYVGNGQCQPLTSDVFAKYYVHGTITYHNINRLFPNATKAEWTLTQSAWFFPLGFPQIQYVIDALNQYCPCGGAWAAGTWRTVDASSCDVSPGEMPYLCAMISGQTGYASYSWLDPRTYISSPIQFDPDTGYAEAPDSRPRYRLPQSGDMDPTDCDYVRWSTCGDGVSSSATLCDTCITSLECTGCLYRLLPTASDRDAFGECCPCIWYYGERYQIPWMQLPC